MRRNERKILHSASKMTTSGQHQRKAILLQERERITNELYNLPYDLILYLERATIHQQLGYPDLAAGDAYKALLLTDEARDESFEYHEQALEALQARRQHRFLSTCIYKDAELRDGEEKEEDWSKLAGVTSLQCYLILSTSLLQCGSLKSAYDFGSRGLAIDPGNEVLHRTRKSIEAAARHRLGMATFNSSELPDQGLVRREIYPWNDHEPDRYAQSTLDNLNAELAACAPKCHVRAVSLPTLLEFSCNKEDSAGEIPTNLQLGLFAKEDIHAGETVLDEYSLLTANNRLKASFCDACSTELPRLSSPLAKEIRTCEECSDIMFCNDYCYEAAMEKYHPAVCDKDVDTIGKDPDPKQTPNALYLLLLARSMAMAATQETHPLDLQEIKFIWGDFLPSEELDIPTSSESTEAELEKEIGVPPVKWTLPFSFKANIESPLHILEKMDIDIFQDLEFYDIWVLNTLYSKFRGTASARQSTCPGASGPEVAAVHPLWCLANHNCDPNISWEWGGRMKFKARETRVVGGGNLAGIRAGEEVLSHYCDVELPVTERREWALGSLGGKCMCDRCRREATEGEVVNGIARIGT